MLLVHVRMDEANKKMHQNGQMHFIEPSSSKLTEVKIVLGQTKDFLPLAFQQRPNPHSSSSKAAKQTHVFFYSGQAQKVLEETLSIIVAEYIQGEFQFDVLFQLHFLAYFFFFL